MFRPREITRLYFLWPDRNWLAGPQSAFPTERFLDYLGEEAGSEVNRDDLVNVLDLQKESLGSLYAIFDTFLEGLEPVFYDGEPSMLPDKIPEWRLLTEYIDEDSLISFALADRGYPILPGLENWGMIVAGKDVTLNELASKGLTDTHVHLGGSSPTPIIWQALMSGELKQEQLPAYRIDRQKLERGTAYEGQRRLDREKRLLSQCRDSRGILLRCLKSRLRTEDKLPAIHPQLLEERHLLFNAWKTLKLNHFDPIAPLLDQYLVGKSLFLRRHRQHRDANSGLLEFKKFFDRGKITTPSASGKITTRASKRLQWRRLGQTVRFLTETPGLRSISIRIAPFDDMGQYIRFFDLWRSHWPQFLQRNGIQTKVNFIIHFIRQGQKNTSDTMERESMRRTVERQSALLHLFRCKYPELAQVIVGLDVANLERYCPPYLVTPFLKMLRGDFDWKGDLQFCRTWNRLLERGLHLHPADLPKLGLTYHAGEDWFTPLDGMNNMEQAVRGSNMVAGDRLGHGLAAGWDVMRFLRQKADSCLIPCGFLCDSLVWLYCHNRDKGDVLLESLGRYIEELAGMIYDGSVPLINELERLAKVRHGLPPALFKSETDTQEYRLWRMELYDAGCQRRRMKLMPLKKDIIKWLPLIDRAQKNLVHYLDRKRIVVEFCPTSNLVTSGFTFMRYHPYFRYYEILGNPPLASFNSDDPGVFHTRVDIELCLMAEAMRDNQFDEHLIHTMLKKAVLTANNYSW